MSMLTLLCFVAWVYAVFSNEDVPVWLAILFGVAFVVSFNGW